jgi:hypothetical protein
MPLHALLCLLSLLSLVHLLHLHLHLYLVLLASGAVLAQIPVLTLHHLHSAADVERVVASVMTVGNPPNLHMSATIGDLLMVAHLRRFLRLCFLRAEEHRVEDRVEEFSVQVAKKANMVNVCYA